MPAILYPPEPNEEDTRESWERRALRPWRMEVKHQLLTQRGFKCAREGCPNRAQDLDEAILTRQEMRGLSLAQRRLAFASCNLELVCADHNRNGAQDREGAWARACARYGERTMRRWYAGIGLKAPRAEWMP